MRTSSDNLRLADSLAALTGPAGSVEDIRVWVKKRNEAVKVSVDLVDFASLKQWKFNSSTGDLEHESNYLRGRVGTIEVPREHSLDINDIWDFKLAEIILKETR